MSEELHLTAGTDRAALYEELLPQVRSLATGDPDPLANLAQLVAALVEAVPRVSWCGVYLLRGDDLVLGPFQGRIACTRIAPGKGVCGAAASRRETVVVADVELFPGHIACDSRSRSEIVLPLLDGGRLAGVLDLDSTEPGNFDARDAAGLAPIAALAAPLASAILRKG